MKGLHRTDLNEIRQERRWFRAYVDGIDAKGGKGKRRVRMARLRPVMLLPENAVISGTFEIAYGQWSENLIEGDLVEIEAQVHRVKHKVWKRRPGKQPYLTSHYDYTLRRVHEVIRKNRRRDETDQEYQKTNHWRLK